jgi:murein DD-endopeptidase MepM/ murein hydrolase activator NlpD
VADHDGGRIDLLVAHEEADGESEFGPLLYLSVTTRGTLARRWLGDGTGRLASLDGSEEEMIRPVSGRISSAPGLRVHPVLRFLRWHRGTDFAAPTGTPVRAALNGIVMESGWRGGYGKIVRLRHGDGTTTVYAHLSAINVVAGEQVARGEVLGAVGETGLTTGPHLHFEWLRDDRVLHPTFAYSNEPTLAHDGRTLAQIQELLTSPFRSPPRWN